VAAALKSLQGRDPVVVAKRLAKRARKMMAEADQGQNVTTWNSFMVRAVAVSVFVVALCVNCVLSPLLVLCNLPLAFVSVLHWICFACSILLLLLLVMLKVPYRVCLAFS
jgi:hypothetical protein